MLSEGEDSAHRLTPALPSTHPLITHHHHHSSKGQQPPPPPPSSTCMPPNTTTSSPSSQHPSSIKAHYRHPTSSPSVTTKSQHRHQTSSQSSRPTRPTFLPIKHHARPTLSSPHRPSSSSSSSLPKEASASSPAQQGKTTNYIIYFSLFLYYQNYFSFTHATLYSIIPLLPICFVSIRPTSRYS